MKKYRISILAIIIAVLITTYFFVIMNSWSGSVVISNEYDSESVNFPTNDTAFGDLFEYHHVDDSLPHYKYQQMRDSIDLIKTEKKFKYSSSGESIFLGAVGFAKNVKPAKIRLRPEENDSILIKMKDTMDNLSSYFPATSKEKEDSNLNYLRDLSLRYNERGNALRKQYKASAEKEYWLCLKGYQTADGTKFFIHHDKYYLAVIKWDSVKYRNSNSTKYGHYIRKEIPFWYSVEDQTVKIPVSKSKYSFLKGFLNVLVFVILFVIAFVYIGLPIQVLLNISRGRPFSRQNNRAFRLMAGTLITLTLLYIVSPYIFYIFYKQIIPSEIWLEPFWPRVYSKLYLFLIAAVIFIIGKAFAKGFRLQEEEDLTV